MDSDNIEQYDKTNQETIELAKLEKIWEKIEIG